MSENIKACPFCGKVPTLSERISGAKFVHCETIGCIMAGSLPFLDDWNRRPAAPDDAKQAAEKSAMEALEEITQELYSAMAALWADKGNPDNWTACTKKDRNNHKKMVAQIIHAMDLYENYVKESK